MEEEITPIPPALPTQPQKRILALSVVGDMVWRMSQPALDWMIENGDEELSEKAWFARWHWDINQAWFIEWGNNTRFFELAELACRDLKQFRQAICTIPADNEGVARIVELALLTGKEFHKPTGLGWNSQRKHSRGKRGKR